MVQVTEYEWFSLSLKRTTCKKGGKVVAHHINIEKKGVKYSHSEGLYPWLWHNRQTRKSYKKGAQIHSHSTHSPLSPIKLPTMTDSNTFDNPHGFPWWNCEKPGCTASFNTEMSDTCYYCKCPTSQMAKLSTFMNEQSAIESGRIPFVVFFKLIISHWSNFGGYWYGYNEDFFHSCDLRFPSQESRFVQIEAIIQTRSQSPLLCPYSKC